MIKFSYTYPSHLILAFLGALLNIMLFITLEMSFGSFIGKFPAEDLRSANPDASFNRALCLPSDEIIAQRDFTTLNLGGADIYDYLRSNTIIQTTSINSTLIQGVHNILKSNYASQSTMPPSVQINVRRHLYPDITYARSFSLPLVIFGFVKPNYFPTTESYGLTPSVYWQVHDNVLVGKSQVASDDEPIILEFKDKPQISSVLKNSSESLFFTGNGDKVIAIDAIDQVGRLILWDLYLSKSISNYAEIDRFVQKADKYFPKCDTPISDRGITEGYWAAKGSSVIHHWAHLYEAAVDGNPKLAQYGYFIPIFAKKLSQFLDQQGPTGFVRISWTVFQIFGIAYIILFFCIFKTSPFIATWSVLIKICIFSFLNGFSITLAPGFQWFREFVFLAVGISFYNVFSNQFAFNIKLRIISILFSLALIFFSYLVDPFFATISIVCGIIAFVATYVVPLCIFLCKYRKFTIILISLILLSLSLVSPFLFTKLTYVFDKITNGDFGLYQVPAIYYDEVAIIYFIAIITIITSLNRKKFFLPCYFAFGAFFLSIYFFSVPDKTHIIKYVEYCVPLFASFILIVRKFVIKNFFIYKTKYLLKFTTTNVVRVNSKRHMDFILSYSTTIKLTLFVIFTVLLAVKCLQEISTIGVPYEYQLRLYDNLGSSYFNYTKSQINGRRIDANLSTQTIDHLQKFPNNLTYNYLISPYDKYIIFLYDKRNGFEGPDFVSWVNSNERLSYLQKNILNTDKDVRVLLDLNALDLDLRYGIFSSNSWLGSLHKASKLVMKNRLRVLELASDIINTCEYITQPINSKWVLFECAKKIKGTNLNK